jgi:hypothetical protein
LRVALCFSGQPRNIENPYTWLSHKHHIIDKYQADVFAHTWINDDERQFDYSDWVYEKSITESQHSDELILKKYKLKNHIFEKPKHFTLDEKSRTIITEKENVFFQKYNQRHYSLNNENNTLSQLYSVSKSIELIDGKYDWVILSRYDNYIWNMPNLYQLDKDNLYLNNRQYFNFSDLLIFGGQEQIETLNCYNKIPELCEKINYFTPEEFKRVAYQNVYKPTDNKNEYEYIIGQEKRISIGVGIARLKNSIENLQI